MGLITLRFPSCANGDYGNKGLALGFRGLHPKPQSVMSVEVSMEPVWLQALNISQSAVTGAIANDLNNFIAQGNVTALTAGQSDAPLLAARASVFGQAGQLQAAPNPHRYPLAQGLLAEV